MINEELADCSLGGLLRAQAGDYEAKTASLIAELEKARGERDSWKREAEMFGSQSDMFQDIYIKATAQRDAAYALLRDSDKAMEGIDHFDWRMVNVPMEASARLQSRIEAIRYERARISALLEPAKALSTSAS